MSSPSNAVPLALGHGQAFVAKVKNLNPATLRAQIEPITGVPWPAMARQKVEWEAAAAATAGEGKHTFCLSLSRFPTQLAGRTLNEEARQLPCLGARRGREK